MASKTVNINLNIKPIQEWLQNFFKTMDQYEMIAVAGIGLGLILLIVGLILL